jgi:hypothetical protein
VTDDDRDLRLRHLDTLQTVINRLSQNSFTIRGWSITVASVILAFASTRSGAQDELVVLALAPAWTFWGLDAYYLRRERLFRQLHTAVARRLIDAASQPDIEPFDMRVDGFQGQVLSWRRLLLVPNVAAIPAALTVITLGVALFEAIDK